MRDNGDERMTEAGRVGEGYALRSARKLRDHPAHSIAQLQNLDNRQLLRSPPTSPPHCTCFPMPFCTFFNSSRM